MKSKEFCTYDTVTDWSGPIRGSVEAAQKDADRHNQGCAELGSARWRAE